MTEMPSAHGTPHNAAPHRGHEPDAVSPRRILTVGAELVALVYLGAIVTTGGFLCWYTAVGILGVERAGLFAGVLPVSALACSAALGVAGVTPERLVAVAVVVAGITLGVRAGRTPTPAPQGAEDRSLLRSAPSGASLSAP